MERYDELDEFDDEYDDLEEDSYDEEELTEKIAKIINVSKAIANTYQGIIFDNDNKILLNELEQLKKYENQLYEDLDLMDMHKLVAVKTILREFGNVYGFQISNPFGAACNHEIKDLWAYRMEDKMMAFSKGKLDSVIRLINDKDAYISNDDMEDLQRTKIDEALSDDFVHAFIYFMDDEIVKCEEGNLKQYLIETKYKLTYITSKLDDDLIENAKNDNKPLYIYFGMISDMLSAPKAITNDIQEESALTYLDYAIGNIELLKEYGGSEELEKIFTIYFRAGLALMYNCENYELLIDDIKLDVIGDNGDDTFSCLKEYVQTDNLDKGKCRYLSLYK